MSNDNDVVVYDFSRIYSFPILGYILVIIIIIIIYYIIKYIYGWFS